MGRCDVVVVESVAQAKVECGELMLAEDRGTFQWAQAVEMRHLVLGLAGMRPGRRRSRCSTDSAWPWRTRPLRAWCCGRRRSGASGRVAHRGAVHRWAADPVGGEGGRPIGGPSTGSGRTDALQGLSAAGVVDCRQAGTEGLL